MTRPVLHVAECLGPHGSLLAGEVRFLAITSHAPLDPGDRAYVQSRYGYPRQVFGSFGATVEDVRAPLDPPRFVTSWACLRLVS